VAAPNPRHNSIATHRWSFRKIPAYLRLIVDTIRLEHNQLTVQGTDE
jgi:hypothetical protein